MHSRSLMVYMITCHHHLFLYFRQLAGAAFIAIGFWAWSEKVGEHQNIINILLSCWRTDTDNGSLLVFCV